MEQNQCAPQHRGTSDTPSVLLAGFPNVEAESTAAALDQMEWALTVPVKEAEIEAAVAWHTILRLRRFLRVWAKNLRLSVSPVSKQLHLAGTW